MNAVSIAFVFRWLSYACVFASVVAAWREGCVLDSNGQEICSTVTEINLPVLSERRRKPPCARQDIECWSEKARQYTNEVRRKNKVKKMLRPGTISQMRNAMRWAAHLSRIGKLIHQKLGKDALQREVKCKRWMAGENLAYNYESGDIARAAVDQWTGSQEHFENQIRDYFEEVVTAFHFARDGRIYAVQTFAVPHHIRTYGNPKARICRPLPSSGRN